MIPDLAGFCMNLRVIRTPAAIAAVCERKNLTSAGPTFSNQSIDDKIVFFRVPLRPKHNILQPDVTAIRPSDNERSCQIRERTPFHADGVMGASSRNPS